MPGPAPSPNPRRRNARPGVVLLPAEGYLGQLPDWPLATRASRAEAGAWADLWRKPQGHAWAQLRLERTVARYVRALVRAEQRGAQAFLLSEVRQLEAALGLNAMSMLRLRWEVDQPAQPAQDEGADEGNVSSLDDRRRRLAGE